MLNLRARRALELALVVCLGLGPLFAQSRPSSDDTPEPLKVPEKPVQQKKRRGPAKFRAQVDQVVIYASIYNEESQLVSGLSQEDFTIYEDKVQQQLTYFGQDDVPSTVGLVTDISGSMRNKFTLVNEATQLFLSMNNPQNEIFLISFKSEASLEEDFTRDVEDIRDALDNLVVSGGTALYDAIYLAVDKSREGSEPKKTVLVFTDGEDKDSYYTHEELLDKIRESDVQVYIVAFLDRDLSDAGGFFGIFKSQREKVQETISSIADYTGGKSFFPEEILELKEIFQSIAYELRNQYRMAYISSNLVRDGNWRDIDVVVQDAKKLGLKVRAKRGYFAENRTSPPAQD